MFRHAGGGEPLEVLVGHMGGPYWARKDERAWSVPKGEVEASEALQEAAAREFGEETGLPVPPLPWLDLGSERQRSGKTVHLFAVEADVDLSAFAPGTFPMTVRGRSFEVPEIDRVAYVSLEDAGRLLVAGQVPFLARLQAQVR